MRRWINLIESSGPVVTAFHGTQSHFDNFALPLDLYDPSAPQRLGFWFTESKDAALIFAHDEREIGDGQARLLTARLDLGTTLVVQDWSGLHDAAGAILKPYDYKQYEDAFASFTKRVHREYDSITVENCTSDYGPRRTDYVVFNSSQITIINREELPYSPSLRPDEDDEEDEEDE